MKQRGEWNCEIFKTEQSRNRRKRERIGKFKKTSFLILTIGWKSWKIKVAIPLEWNRDLNKLLDKLDWRSGMATVARLVEKKVTPTPDHFAWLLNIYKEEWLLGNGCLGFRQKLERLGQVVYWR